MKHARIIWNSAMKQWFCATCGRTSDHARESDAREELDHYECQVPYVQAAENAPGEETVQLIQKPFKMVPRRRKE
jgi:hypothetical protein